MLSGVSSGLTTIFELSDDHLLAIAGLVVAAVAQGEDEARPLLLWVKQIK